MELGCAGGSTVQLCLGTRLKGMWNSSGVAFSNPSVCRILQSRDGPLGGQGVAGASDAPPSTGGAGLGGAFFFSVILFPVKKLCLV